MGLQKKHPQELILEAGKKAAGIIKGEERSIYHLEHLEETPLPVWLEEHFTPSCSFPVGDDCCGMIIAGEHPHGAPKPAAAEDNYQPSY